MILFRKSIRVATCGFKYIRQNYNTVQIMLVELTGFTFAVSGLLGVGVLGCCGSSQQQQQQITVPDTDSSEPKRVCPDCGMENPREANHCGDCGFSFKPSEGE